MDVMPVDKGVAWPRVACCLPAGWECHCPPMEAALRAWATGQVKGLLNSEQRAACLSEIGAIEGYRAEDYSDASDVDLARAVLDAWTDFCRDKGML
jgi:hypothetical protein